VVLTEAASGSYAVTPIIAGLAGAQRIYAVTRSTAWGTLEAVEQETMDLAERAGVADRVVVIQEKTEAILRSVDIVTNSGHVRPIDASTISFLKPSAVVPLMYEAWEYRAADVDVDACRMRGIQVAGTNERHPAIDMFSRLGPMAVRLLFDAGIQVYESRIVVVCDNPFGAYIEPGLRGLGASVCQVTELAAGSDDYDCDAILVAATPGQEAIIGAREARLIAESYPDAVVVQFWGDLDRDALRAHDVPFWPAVAPPTGHMGVLPSSIGPEPIVRLQTGGWKVGEVLLKGHAASAEDLSFVQWL
jgi:hypothetical protein